VWIRSRPRADGGEGRRREGAADRGERGLRPPLPVDEAEIPVGHVVAPAVPLIGPGEDEDARGAGAESVAHLPLQRFCLGCLAVAATVDADLGDQQRPVPREVLQAGEVGLEGPLVLEEDVERGEIEEGQLEILGRGIVDVGDEAVGVHGLCLPVQALYKTLDLALAVPAHDRGGDLVAHRVAEDRGVGLACPHLGGNPGDDRIGPFRVVEEGDVLLPGQPHHHLQAMRLRHVQQP
jgi:hypothetical protein